MNLETKIQQAESNLQRKLEWIERHDNRVVFLTGIIIAMLGVFASSIAMITTWTCFDGFVAIMTGSLLLISLTIIFFGHYPKMRSLNTSLIFFDTISRLSFNEFKQRVESRTEEDYLDDLLNQIYVNSQILSSKFRSLKNAFIFMGISLVPWLYCIYISKLYFK